MTKIHNQIQVNPNMLLLDDIHTYTVLRKAVTKQGILDRSYTYYSLLSLFIFSGFFLSIYAIIVSQSYLSLVLWGIVFSFFTGQVAGILHDCGHRAIFNSSIANDILGNICGGLTGVVYDSWKIKHNLHHAHPNQEDHDPDAEVPLLSFTRDRYDSQKGIGRLVRRHQAYLFYPLGTLVVFTLRVTGIRFLLKEMSTRKKILKFCIVGTGIFAWIILPFIAFSITKALILFLIVNAATGLYLFNIFAPNHKGMPKLAKEEKLSFLEQQIITSRNIYGHWLTNFIYMGLNYQIEHHLFPNCPRNKLHFITPYVQAICREKKLAYTQVSVIESNRIIISELAEIASSTKAI